MRFTGHERDLGALSAVAQNSPQADDLDYMHARHFSPMTGRSLSVDRVEGVSSAPQTWNRYAYVRNNPLKLVDPTGLYFVWASNLSAGDAAFLKHALSELARRSSGRALVSRLGRDPRAIVLGTRSFNSKAAIAAVLRGDVRDIQFGEHDRTPGNVPMPVSLDRGAIETLGRFSQFHIDPFGITTLAHELRHADKALYGSDAEYRADDLPTSQTGPAQRFAEAVYRERPDMSDSDAAAFVQGLFLPPVTTNESNALDQFLGGTACLEGVCFTPITGHRD